MIASNRIGWLIFLGALGLTGAASAATYYVSPTGSDTAVCSAAAPCATFAKAYSVMKSGDTLIAKNGTYNRIVLLDRNTIPPSGTPSAYTVVKAETDGSVVIDGQGQMSPILIDGTPNKTMQYVQIQGLICRHQAGTAMIYSNAGQIHHVKFVRDGFEDASDGNAHVFALTSGSGNSGGIHDILVEECFSWGAGRYKFSTYYGLNIIFRRCVARFDRSNPQSGANTDPIAGFAAYASENILFQNCIVIDSDHPEFWLRDEGEWGGFFVPTTADISPNVSIVGSIVLNTAMGFGGTDWGADNAQVTNSVGWHVREGMWLRNGPAFNHCTFGDLQGPGLLTKNVGLQYSVGGNGNPVAPTMINSIVQNVQGTALTNFSSENYNVLYGNTANYSGTPAGANTKNQNPNLKYILRVETDNTLLHGTGNDGGDRGANIVNKFGTTGSLWGDPGYNTVMNESLWPFPYEDVIQRYMKTYSYTGLTTAGNTANLSGNRGFCVDGQTLTNYIWTYLGNPNPYSAPPPTGNTYYVSPSGNDSNNGSIGSPWLTLQHAADSVKAGDTVNVSAGNYVGFKITTSGTQTAPIVFNASPGAVIDRHSADTSEVTGGIYIRWADYITIQGFTIQPLATEPTNWYAIDVSGRGMWGTTFDNQWIWGHKILNNNVIGRDADYKGIFTRWTADTLIEGNTVSGFKGGGNGAPTSIYVSNSAHDYVIRNNIAHDTDPNVGACIHNNGDAGSDAAFPFPEFGTNWNALIENNIVYNCAAGINGDGLRNSVIRNNIVYNSSRAIKLYASNAADGPSKDVIVNNTFVGRASASSSMVRFGDYSHDDNVFFNNIVVYADGKTFPWLESGVNLVADYNTLPGNSSDGGAHSFVVSNPTQLFVDATANDFHLKPGSLAIDAGTASFSGNSAPPIDGAGAIRPQGKGWDLGSYEFGNAPPPALVTLTVTSAGAGTGAVQLNPAGGTYPMGTTVTLTANPAVGSAFVGWSGNLNGSVNPTTLTMSVNQSVTATFNVVVSSPDTTLPTVNMTSPLSNDILNGTVSLSASASDNVGVTRVDFYVDGIFTGTDPSAPYTYAWNTLFVKDGSHALMAKAFDAAGNMGPSATITVTVLNTGSGGGPAPITPSTELRDFVVNLKTGTMSPSSPFPASATLAFFTSNGRKLFVATNPDISKFKGLAAGTYFYQRTDDGSKPNRNKLTVVK